jgi:hypothetical protein
VYAVAETELPLPCGSSDCSPSRLRYCRALTLSTTYSPLVLSEFADCHIAAVYSEPAYSRLLSTASRRSIELAVHQWAALRQWKACEMKLSPESMFPQEHRIVEILRMLHRVHQQA